MSHSLIASQRGALKRPQNPRSQAAVRRQRIKHGFKFWPRSLTRRIPTGIWRAPAQVHQRLPPPNRSRIECRQPDGHRPLARLAHP